MKRCGGSAVSRVADFSPLSSSIPSGGTAIARFPSRVLKSLMLSIASSVFGALFLRST